MLGLDHSTVVRQIAAVERLGFAERRPHPRDARSVLVGMIPFVAAPIAKMRAKRRAPLSVIPPIGATTSRSVWPPWSRTTRRRWRRADDDRS